ncbi:TIGR00282 family metallophosphoesterase [Chloroflexota bacterium]
MKILVVGDIVGKPGREAVRELVPQLRRQYQLDMVIANCENAAGGVGITQATAENILDAEVDVLTTGNHVWRRKDVLPYLDSGAPIIRPLNYPQGVPGRGYIIASQVMVVNLVGRTFMQSYDCPFRAIDGLLENLSKRPKIVIVDMHAEATSEKVAIGWHLNGRVTAVVGTHTHVGTVDARVLPKGTAYVTDIGMVGPTDSVIGADKEAVLSSFLTQMPFSLSVGTGDTVFNSVLIEIDETTGRAISINRVDKEIKQ